MQTYTFRVFPRSDRVVDLRFFDAQDHLIGSRTLDIKAVERFAAEVDAGYGTVSPRLEDLGQRLYAWLDGPTERWLEGALQNAPDLALRIDASERLRHLPWELLCRAGAFLGVNAHRPFTPVYHVTGPSHPVSVANRPLRLLFMASSAEGVRPVLDFEREERVILEGTQNSQLELFVEESGSLAGLLSRLNEEGPGIIDIVHISGHADVRDGRPYFILEDEFGDRKDASVDDVARVFSGRWPRLVFLSGCRTGQASDRGAVPSLCEALVAAGAPAVLGWTLPVGDRSASTAAAKLYGELSLGKPVDEAVAAARRALFEAGSPYWHLLRLYAGPTPLSSYVTTLRTPGRARIHRREAAAEFLDAGAKVEVCRRRDFVGRRRAIQRCLRILRGREGDAGHGEGVLLQGMGGLGKSSLAARLCERMSAHQRVVWTGRVDEIELLRVLGDRLGSVEANKVLGEPGLGLKQRLTNLLGDYLSTRPTLFVFDDFEHNLDAGIDGTHVVKREALEVLGALLAAIRGTASESRVLVTSRYDFALPGPARLHVEKLDSLRGADLDKKVALLPRMSATATTDKALRDRAVALSAGNPRLLERLDRALGEAGMDHAALLDALEAKTDEFREELLLRALLERLAPEGRKLLARVAVYDLPIERAGVEAVAGDGAVEPHLGRAVALGIAEAGVQGGETRYYVSPIVRPLLGGELAISEQSTVMLHALTYVSAVKPRSIEWGLETHRLAMQVGEKRIAVTVGNAIAVEWVNGARYHEALALCQETLRLGDDYRILHTIARAEHVLGHSDAAFEHYELALASCQQAQSQRDDPSSQELAGICRDMANVVAEQGNVQRARELLTQALAIEKKLGNAQDPAATLNIMAWLTAQQGDIEHAIDLWDESIALQEKSDNVRGIATTLSNKAWAIAQQKDTRRAIEIWDQCFALQEKIDDVKGMAATLDNKSWVLAQQGDTKRAIEIGNQSLVLSEKIGDVRGQAAALANLASAAGKDGDHVRKRALNVQAARLLGQIRAWLDLTTVLGNLGTSNTPDAPAFLAQALWLAHATEVPLADAITITHVLLMQLTPEHPSAPLLAAAAGRLVARRGASHPQRQELLNHAGGMLGACTAARGIVPADFPTWAHSEGLDDPERLLPALRQALESLGIRPATPILARLPVAA